MERLTHERCSGIKTGYWSAAKKDELIDRLAEYENTGLTPEEIKTLLDPADDVVEVVRCGECDFWDSNHISCEDRAKCLTGEAGIRYRGRMDFCSYGKRKDGADNA